MFISNNWKDYEILDAGDGEKLERWGNIIVVRPDPQIIWPKMLSKDAWENCHMRYYRSKSGGGSWQHVKKTPDKWLIEYRGLRFNIKPTDFKHMGLFPEQASNWDWVTDIIKDFTKRANRPAKILNLFGYTGGATVCCLKAQAQLTHVDAAKGMNQWAKENIIASNLEEGFCRIITDDVYKFVQREQRRNNFYDGIILDPPSYGRGPSGEVWKLENRLFDLLSSCVKVLSNNPLFMLLNTYTAGFSATAAENVLKLALSRANIAKKNVVSGSLGIPVGKGDIILPCGTSVRWA